jgi:hypothetical protein
MFATPAVRAASFMYDEASVRRLGCADAFCAADFVATLPEHSRYGRFNRAMNPGMVHAHYQALDWDTAIVLAWIEGGEILGIAEVHPYAASGSREAEIALALDWDSDRIGEPLMACALRHAAAAGARHSWMLLCPPDPAQFVIARKLGGKFDVAQDICSFTHRRFNRVPKERK